MPKGIGWDDDLNASALGDDDGGDGDATAAGGAKEKHRHKKHGSTSSSKKSASSKSSSSKSSSKKKHKHSSSSSSSRSAGAGAAESAAPSSSSDREQAKHEAPAAKESAPPAEPSPIQSKSVSPRTRSGRKTALPESSAGKDNKGSKSRSQPSSAVPNALPAVVASGSGSSGGSPPKESARSSPRQSSSSKTRGGGGGSPRSSANKSSAPSAKSKKPKSSSSRAVSRTPKSGKKKAVDLNTTTDAVMASPLGYTYGDESIDVDDDGDLEKVGKEKAKANAKGDAVNETQSSPDSSLDVWSEDGAGGVGGHAGRDIEAASPASTDRSTPPAGGRSARGAGAGGAAQAADKGRGGGSSCHKKHLCIAFVVLAVVAAGGTVAALLVTGVIGTDSNSAEISSSEGIGGGGGSGSSDAEFAPLTLVPNGSPGSQTASPAASPSSTATGGDGSTAGDVSYPPTEESTLYPTAGPPTISPYPTITGQPTSCTESSDLFKYFGDNDSVVTSSCKKLTLSTEDDATKCGRTIVFGGGSTVWDKCPLLCGGCAGTPSTLTPTVRPTGQPTTAEPTVAETAEVTVESTLEPTLEPVAAPVAAAVADDGSPYAGHDTFSFYVMGDIPYMYKEELTLIEQLQDQANGLANDDAVFQVHVGDIQNPKRSGCVEQRYSLIANYFKDYCGLPTFMLPGDNDWNDCPDPDLAWEYWTTQFLGFENNWSDRSDFPGTVIRQDVQPENFAFTRAGILFLGLNLVGGRINEYVTQDDWDLRIDRDIDWATEQMSEHYVGEFDAGYGPSDSRYIRAVVAFGHSPRARRFNMFLKERMMGTGVPVLYLHGNGHDYVVDQPFLLDDGWDTFWQVQVDQGANAPPARVTVRGTTPEAMQMSMEVDGGGTFGDFIKLDRRGGLYPGVEVETDGTVDP